MTPRLSALVLLLVASTGVAFLVAGFRNILACDARTRRNKVLFFLASLVPVSLLVTAIGTSRWLFDRYGFAGAWIMFPVVLLVFALLLAGTYYCFVFVLGSVFIRAGASLALAVLAVIIALAVCVGINRFLPRAHRSMVIRPSRLRPNQAMELTAFRTAFTFSMTKAFPLRDQLALGSGSSSFSR
jgi:hypothetical protein